MTDAMKIIDIEGSGGGSKSGSGATASSSHTAIQYAQSLRCRSQADIIELLCEGPIEGPVAAVDAYRAGGHTLAQAYLQHSPESIAFDFTPVLSPGGSVRNYNGWYFNWRTGTGNQTAISQGNGIKTEVSVNLKVTHSSPVVQVVNQSGIDSLIVTLSVPSFYKIGPKTGDYKNALVNYTITVQGSGSPIVAVTGTMEGQTLSAYQRQHVIEDLISTYGEGPYTVTVTRTNNDEAQTYCHDELWWSSYTGVVPYGFTWPYVALLRTRINAKQFGASIPSRAVEIYGYNDCPVPSNYDPWSESEDRTSGDWSGTWHYEWTDNPAWCFLAMLTNERFGLGRDITDLGVLKWQLYKIAKYCDEFVPVTDSNGTVTYERRWTFNRVIQTREEAYHVMGKMASAFVAMPVWASNQVLIMQDAPYDSDTPSNINATHIANASNVADGMFNYSGSSINARRTVARVTWNDPEDFGRPAIALWEDPVGIARYGYRPIDVEAIGCNSVTQAIRYGRWIILNQGDIATFVGDMSFGDCQPGNRIAAQDPHYRLLRTAGRVAGTASVLADKVARISLVDGTAFIDTDGTYDLSAYVGKYLTITDTSGYTIKGWAKAAGPGETLGDNLLPASWVNDGGAPYSTLTTSGNDVTSGISSGVAYARQTVTLTANRLHKLTYSLTVTSGSVLYTFSGNAAYSGNGSFSTLQGAAGANTRYATGTALDAGVSIYNASATNFSLSGFSVKQVLTPSVKGLTIVSTSHGTTYNWAAKDATFNPNGTTFTIQISDNETELEFDAGFSYIQLDSSVTLESDRTYTLTFTVPMDDTEIPVEAQDRVLKLVEAEVLNDPSTTNYLKIGTQTVLPEIMTYWMLHDTTILPRYFTCLSNAPKPGMQHQITGLLHDYTKYDRIYANINTPAPPTSDVPTGVIAAPTALATSEYSYESGNNWRPGLHVSWTHTPDPRIVLYRVEWTPSDEEHWRLAGETSDPSFNIQPVPAGTYDVRVRGQGTTIGTWATITDQVVVGKTSDPPAVTGIQVKGGGTTFDDRDLHLEWTTVVDEDGMPKSRFWRYKVRFYELPGDIVNGSDLFDYQCILTHTCDEDNFPGSGVDWQLYWVKLSTRTGPACHNHTEYHTGTPILKWTKLTTNESFNFSFTSNVKAFGSAKRQFMVSVVAVDIYRNEGTETLISFSNTIPDMSAFTPILTSMPHGVDIDWSSWDHSSIPDLFQFKIYSDENYMPMAVAGSVSATADRFVFNDGIKDYSDSTAMVLPYDKFGPGIQSQLGEVDREKVTSTDMVANLNAEMVGGKTAAELGQSNASVCYLADYASFSAAITEIGSTVMTLILNDDSTVSADLTVPLTLSLVASHGNKITVATTKTLTINGPFICPGTVQAFVLQGTGKVAFGEQACTDVHPEWFCTNTTPGTTDMTAACQAAIDAAHYGMTLRLAGTLYLLSGSGDELLLVTKLINILGESMQHSCFVIDESVPVTTDIIHIHPGYMFGGQQIAYFSMWSKDYLTYYPQLNGAPGRHAIKITATTSQWNEGHIHHLYINRTDGRSIYIDATGLYGTTMFTISDCYLANGIYGYDLADGVVIQRNSIWGSGYGIDITQAVGGAHLTIDSNDMISSGSIRIGRAVAPMLINNGLEPHYQFDGRSLVSYSGGHYRCKLSHVSSTTGGIIPTNGTYWEVNTGSTANETVWADATRYTDAQYHHVKPSLVSYSGGHYRCILSHKSAATYYLPTNTVYWEVNSGSTDGETVWAAGIAYSSGGFNSVIWLEGSYGYDDTIWAPLITNNFINAIGADTIIGVGGLGCDYGVCLENTRGAIIDHNNFGIPEGCVGVTAGGISNKALKISSIAQQTKIGPNNVAGGPEIVSKHQQVYWPEAYSNTSYVSYSGGHYKCILGHTSSTVAGRIPTNGTYWAVNSGATFGETVWADATVYTADARIGKCYSEYEPTEVYWNGLLAAKGASVGSLTDNQWYWTGGILYLREDSCYTVGGGYMNPYGTFANFPSTPYIDDAGASALGTDTRMGVESRDPVKIFRPFANDGQLQDYITFGAKAYEKSYLHRIRSSHSGVGSLSLLTFNLANGANTDVEVLRLRGDGAAVITGTAIVNKDSSADYTPCIEALSPNTPNGQHSGGIYFGRDATTNYNSAQIFHIPDASTPTSASKIAFFMLNSGELMALSGLGVLNIPSGATYNINGVPHSHEVEGWVSDTDTWTYASSTTFTIAGKDVTSRFPVGCKLCLTQTSAKYFYVVSAAFSTDTTITVTGGSDYTLADAAITAPKYSYASSPTGFPHWFNYNESWVGFSSSPTGGICRFMINGRLVKMNIARGAGTSNGATITVSIPVTARTATGQNHYGPGWCVVGTSNEAANYIVSSGATVAALYRQYSAVAWPGSGTLNWVGDIEYEI